MLTRSVFALAVALGFGFTVRAADLPTGTWAVNIDGTKGDFVVTQAKDGKFSGALLGTDVSGTWNGKTLAFAKGKEAFEAHLVSEPGEKGKVKYTLTGTRAVTTYDFTTRAGTPHTVKTGWYAQLTADAPALTGSIRAEVRGVLVTEATTAYVSVKADGAPETRVWFRPTEEQWKVLRPMFKELSGKEVVVTGKLGQLVKPGPGAMGDGALYFLDLPETLKAAPAEKK